MQLTNEAARTEAILAYSREITKFDLYSVKVYIQKEDDVPEGTKRRYFAILKVQGTPRIGPRIHHAFILPIISVWADPYSNDIVKMHLLLKHGIEASTNVENHRLQLQLVKTIKEFGPLIYSKSSSNRMILSCDTTGSIMRFGVHADTYANVRSREDWTKVPIFDTKAKALDALLVESSKRVTIGGLDLINLNTIKDEFMEAMGFEQVPDQVGRGVPMWRGQVDKIARAGGSQGSRGGYDYERVAKTGKDSFVDILQQALEAV